MVWASCRASGDPARLAEDQDRMARVCRLPCDMKGCGGGEGGVDEGGEGVSVAGLIGIYHVVTTRLLDYHCGYASPLLTSREGLGDLQVGNWWGSTIGRESER
jgi:hypothetical protein